MTKRDWRRARVRRETESKYGDGVVLETGARTPSVPKDDLARRRAGVPQVGGKPQRC
jgi:hypothetical protein